MSQCWARSSLCCLQRTGRDTHNLDPSVGCHIVVDIDLLGTLAAEQHHVALTKVKGNKLNYFWDT